MTMLQKNCEACGDLIEVRLADHRRGWGRFCDKACAAAYKCGQRPRDINEYHAKCQNGRGWAAEMLEKLSSKYPDGEPPKAPSVKSQVGKVRVTPKHHSPLSKRQLAHQDWLMSPDGEREAIMADMDEDPDEKYGDSGVNSIA